jgi:methylmalonyl-CoA mutase cobalamin-binding subunit
MKNLTRTLKTALPILLFAAGLSAIALATAGCKAAVSVSGSFATPKEIITGAVQATTNSVTVGGTYQTGTTNLGGTVTIGK